jgi:hypothetical protein
MKVWGIPRGRKVPTDASLPTSGDLKTFLLPLTVLYQHGNPKVLCLYLLYLSGWGTVLNSKTFLKQPQIVCTSPSLGAGRPDIGVVLDLGRVWGELGSGHLGAQQKQSFGPQSWEWKRADPLHFPFLSLSAFLFFFFFFFWWWYWGLSSGLCTCKASTRA